MPDPMDEFTEFVDYVQSRRFLSHVLGVAGLILVCLCLSSGAAAPSAEEMPLLLRFATVVGMAGFAVGDNIPVT
ncbi:MAG: hypothetical protein AB1716_17815 [Planctomycetota bacterium]